MLLGCIADDSTGASDIANTLAKGGMRTVQFIGVPEAGEAPDCDAAVVALKTRSAARDEAVAQSLAALSRLRAFGARQIVFKICSTFDSTPEGNIGPVAQALADQLGATIVPVCPAFPDAGRRVFQGHLFVHDRLLSESGMEKHPLTPMTDPDIRRWLRRQTGAPVGHVPFATIRAGAAATRDGLRTVKKNGARLAICDAVDNADLTALGEACAELPLLVGGSGIAMGLPANFDRAGLLHPGGMPFRGVDGAGCILAGSCSTATLEQIAVYAAGHPALAVDIEAALADPGYAGIVVAFVQANLSDEPLVYSSADAETVAGWQRRLGAETVAKALEGLFAKVAASLVESGVRRLVVAGGETAGAVVAALRIKRLTIGPEIAPGVPVVTVEGPDRIALALKSGNFGDRDFFARALRAMEAA